MTEYRIIPSVTEAGEPDWTLVRDWALPPFGGGSRDVARNSDRQILERAIEHLISQDTTAASPDQKDTFDRKVAESIRKSCGE